MKYLEEFLTPTQKGLFDKLTKQYKNAIVSKNNFILVPGEAPIMLVAHLDTVHQNPVKYICKTENGNILMSPQGIGGDDRCGVYALVTAHSRSAVKPWLLFTCNEEVGCVGASAFCGQHGKGKLPKGLDELKAIVEIDRKGRNDAVYYDCDNPEFEEYITSKGFHTEWGSCSDISLVAPELGVAAVNLSSGYYNAHTQHEYINRKQLNTTVRKVVEIVADAAKSDFPKYEYVESAMYTRFGGGRYGGWCDEPPYDYWTGAGRTATGRKALPDCALMTADDDFDLDMIPKDIRGPYEALLDYYTVDELEALRAEHGDRIIPMTYESEFGCSYLSDEELEELK